MVYIIAEAGVDHEGSFDRAFTLLNAAVKAKADCFKIQYYEKGFKGMYRTLPWLDQDRIFQLDQACEDAGIDFLITPHDLDTIDFVVNGLKHNQIKIGGSGWHLLDAAIATGKSLIVSTGGRSIERVIALNEELHHIASLGARLDILHCIPKYPCPINEAKMDTIRKLRLATRKVARIGYSDHTQGAAVALAAVGMGAKVIEKHITLERNIEGRRDTFCSLLPDEWPKFVQDIRSIEQALAS